MILNVTVTDLLATRARDIADALSTQFTGLVTELETPTGGHRGRGTFPTAGLTPGAYTATVTDKTRIVDVEEGFDFLGFSIRRYPNGKLLIKPSKAAVQRIRSRLAAEVKALHGANAEAVITA